MGKKRVVISYGDYFEDFLKEQTPKEQVKILQVLRLIEELEIIPVNLLKHIKGTDGLYEVRVSFGRKSFRIFCCFYAGNVVLLNAFLKKSQKTPRERIELAELLMNKYKNEINLN